MVPPGSRVAAKPACAGFHLPNRERSAQGGRARPGKAEECGASRTEHPQPAGRTLWAAGRLGATSVASRSSPQLALTMPLCPLLLGLRLGAGEVLGHAKFHDSG